MRHNVQVSACTENNTVQFCITFHLLNCHLIISATNSRVLYIWERALHTLHKMSKYNKHQLKMQKSLTWHLRLYHTDITKSLWHRQPTAERYLVSEVSVKHVKSWENVGCRRYKNVLNVNLSFATSVPVAQNIVSTFSMVFSGLWVKISCSSKLSLPNNLCYICKWATNWHRGWKERACNPLKRACNPLLLICQDFKNIPSSTSFGFRIIQSIQLLSQIRIHCSSTSITVLRSNDCG